MRAEFVPESTTGGPGDKLHPNRVGYLAMGIFALAGTAEQVIAQAAQYRRAGVDELALSFAGPQPTADAAYFARAVKRLIPDGELDRRAPQPS